MVVIVDPTAVTVLPYLDTGPKAPVAVERGAEALSRCLSSACTTVLLASQPSLANHHSTL